MKTNRLFRDISIVLVLICNIGCDQISKSFVRSTIPFNQQFRFLDDHVMFTRVENSGAFLSLGDDLSAGVKFVVLIAIPFIALMVGMYFLFVRSTLSRPMLIALSFIVGGGSGNIYDRYIHGSVTDFMHVDFIFFRTGIFNMADVSIMVGVLIIAAAYLAGRNRIEPAFEKDAIH